MGMGLEITKLWSLLTRLRVLTAANRVVGLAEVRNIWSTETAGCTSLAVTFLRFTIARAASYTTI